MGGATTWRWGVLLDTRTADMLDEVARLSGVRFTCTQGSYSGGVGASAGTHDGGGAVDVAFEPLTQPQRDAVVLAGRQVGFAIWHRTPAQSDWPHHGHGIAGGCPDLSPAARDQWADYLAGRNGLASNGPDDGPRDFDHVGITWEEYQARKGKEPEEDEMKAWAVNVGDGWLITDMATYRNGVADYKVIEDGLALAAFTLFNAGKAVSPPWRDYILALPEVA